jgi:hypothetical protein
MLDTEWLRRKDDGTVARVVRRFSVWYDVVLDDGGRATWLATETAAHIPAEELAACDAAMDEASEP